MKSGLQKSLAVLGSSVVLVIGFDYVTYAATGSSLILGKSNVAGTVTTITNTNPYGSTGAALRLVTKNAGFPPFTTNAKGLVVNLNAQFLGGATRAQLVAQSAPGSITYTDTTTSRSANRTYANVSVPTGVYLVTVSTDMDLNAGGSPTSATNPVEISCWIFDGTRDIIQGASEDIGGPYYTALSASRVVSLTAAQQLALTCSTTAGAGWSYFSDGYGPTMTFTRVGAQATHPIS